VLRARTVDTLDQCSTHPTPRTRSVLNYPRPVVANGVSSPSTKAGSSGRAPMGTVVTTIFFAEVDTYYDGGRCRSSRQHPQGAHRRRLHQLLVVVSELPAAPPGGPPSTSSSTTCGAIGAPGSATRGPAVDVWLKTWYLSPAFLLRDTYKGATMANNTTTDRAKFRRKIFLEKG
jgi:hypothetical protein